MAHSTPKTPSQQSSTFFVSIATVLLLLLGMPTLAQSQNNGNRGRLEIALRLMQQQRYDDALPILEHYTTNPTPSSILTD